MKKEKQKTREFDNSKEALEYLKTKAKKGETIILDERATFSSPRKRSMFSKDKLVREEEIVFEVGTGDMIRDYELLTSDRFLEIYGDEETLKEMGE